MDTQSPQMRGVPTPITPELTPELTPDAARAALIDVL